MSANPPITDWTGKVVWIIGASTGIGRATAAQLHARGAQVIVSARKAPALHQFVREHPGSLALPLDVSDADALPQALRQILAQHGGIDLAMYCAGVYQPMRAPQFSTAVMRQHIEVNLMGAVSMLEVLLPVLLSQGRGHVSLVSSVAGYRGLPQALAYGTSKAAMQYLAETLFLDLRPAGIGVSMINPGFVDTPLTAGNEFPMPALLTPDLAADHILTGWRRGKFDIHFPWRFSIWLKLLRLLPHGLYVRAVHRATGL